MEEPISRPARSRLIEWSLALLIVGIWLLRHDYWNWTKVEPLLFGWLPVGLWWQGLVSILASVAMALLVRFCWPTHLETVETEEIRRRG